MAVRDLFEMNKMKLEFIMFLKIIAMLASSIPCRHLKHESKKNSERIILKTKKQLSKHIAEQIIMKMDGSYFVPLNAIKMDLNIINFRKSAEITV